MRTFKHIPTGDTYKTSAKGDIIINDKNPLAPTFPIWIVDKSKDWSETTKTINHTVITYFGFLNNLLYDRTEDGRYKTRNSTTIYDESVFAFCEIQSLKRNNDGVVFTVGNTLKLLGDRTGVISSIKVIDQNIVQLFYEDDKFRVHLDGAELLATVDKERFIPVKDSYKILAFRRRLDSGCTDAGSLFIESEHSNVFSKAFLNRLDINEIFSVKRLSDGMIFTIDGIVEINNSIRHKIVSITKIDDDFCFKLDNTAIFITTDGPDEIKSLKKLFISEDEVEICKDDFYYSLNISTGDIHKIKAFTADVDTHEDYKKNFKDFSTRKAAEHYSLRIKKCLSIEDITNNCAIGSMLLKELETIVKSRM